MKNSAWIFRLFLVIILVVLMINVAPLWAGTTPPNKESKAAAETKNEIFDFIFTGMVECIDRVPVIKALYPTTKNDVARIGKELNGFKEFIKRFSSRALVSLKDYEIRDTSGRRLFVEMNQEWIGKKRTCIFTASPDIKDLKEGDFVELQVTKIRMIALDCYFYVLTGTKVIERPPTIKMALVVRIDNEERLMKKAKRLREMNNFSNTWEFNYLRDNSGYSLEIAPVNPKSLKDNYDKEGGVSRIIIELPRSLVRQFPEMIFLEDNRAVIWSNVTNKDRSGRGLGLDDIIRIEYMRE